MTDLRRERGRAARHPLHPIFGHPLLNSKEPYYERFILGRWLQRDLLASEGL